MKPLKDILELFPEQSYSDAFSAKFADLKTRASTDDQIQSVEDLMSAHSPVCVFFDSTIEVLRKTISEHAEYEIEDLEAEEIETVLNVYRQHINKLNTVDIGTPDFNTAKAQLNNEAGSISNSYRKNNDNYSSLLRFILGIIQSIKLKPLLDSNPNEALEQALVVAKKLKRKENVINSAHEVAESLLGKREGLIKNDVEDRIANLQDQANSHTGKAVWMWFCSGSILGLFAVFILFGIINGSNFLGISAAKESISFGGATLRLGLVSIVLYFAFYCIKQFTIHRHLHELYNFKEQALQVMLNLRGESDLIEKQLILARGLEAIFSEPSTGLIQQKSDQSGDYWQSAQRILERLVTKNSDPN